MTDRFHQPERPSTSDPRRVFVPAPTAPPTDRGERRPGRGAPPAGPNGTRVRSAVRDAPPAPAYRRAVPERRTRPDRPDLPGPPGEPPGGAPAPARPSRPWWRRLRWRRVLAIGLVLLLLAMVGGYLWARSVWNRIDRVEVSEVLSDGGSGTNYLIVGSDSRENLQEGDPGFDPEGPGGQRSDTMMVLHLEGGKAQMLSLPRDLYVEIADTGDQNKLNAAYNGGPERLIRTVTGGVLQVPVHRYMEVDFVSFAGLVDGLGGVTIEFEHPAFDQMSGLNVPEAGQVELNGDQALAYVRSREFTEVIDGENVKDGTADIGRIERQQKFLRAVFSKLSDTKNPFSLASAFSGLSGGLRVDDDMSMFDAFRLGWALRGVDPESLVLPTDFDRNEAGSVLILREDEAQPILDQVR